MTVDEVRLTNTGRQDARIARSSNLVVDETRSRDEDDASENRKRNGSRPSHRHLN
jgi:hypothetical protein